MWVAQDAFESRHTAHDFAAQRAAAGTTLAGPAGGVEARQLAVEQYLAAS